ncbi:Uncharacterised protein [Legionella pneumophila]|nr:Uncharacterised protein [Legionella pneumophila]CZG57950.1 Uncharacterised protein [Legionella pneumophila]CZG59352.1 Uncharacterised protein [Legionella pneumophila]CZG61760.1 Uncharacterised protein [Legionella pneumophila]CZG61814.1 Uncharacterised protein [Legionella pneumophila]
MRKAQGDDEKASWDAKYGAFQMLISWEVILISPST